MTESDPQTKELAVRPTQGQAVGSDKTARLLVLGLKPDLARLLGEAMSSDRLIRQVVNSVRKNPKLMECDQVSFANAILTAAEKRLEIGYHCHLVPRGREVVFQSDYKGLIDLARRSGKVRSIYARPILQADEWSYEEGSAPRITHKPALQPYHPKDNPLIAVYSRCEYTDGAVEVDLMPAADVERIRERSPAGKSGPWITDYIEMAKKTIVRRHSKVLPMSAEFRDLVELEDDLGDPPPAPEPRSLKMAFTRTLPAAEAVAEVGGELPEPSVDLKQLRLRVVGLAKALSEKGKPGLLPDDWESYAASGLADLVVYLEEELATG